MRFKVGDMVRPSHKLLGGGQAILNKTFNRNDVGVVIRINYDLDLPPQYRSYYFPVFVYWICASSSLLKENRTELGFEVNELEKIC